MRIRKNQGFTLIEMMVVVAIIAIIAAIAYPSYSNYGFRARRADGKEMMMRIAAAQERHYTNLNRYTATLTDLGFPNGTSEQGFYAVSVELANSNQTYTLTATAQGVQATDKCANLTLTNSGAKGFSGNENNGKCW